MLSLKWRSFLGLNVLRRYKDLEGHFKKQVSGCPGFIQCNEFETH